MHIVYKLCPMCSQEYLMVLSNKETKKYEEYISGEGYIQTQLPDLNPVEREFLKTGYCPECQEVLFGNGETDRIRKS